MTTTSASAPPAAPGPRLHVGCGRERLEGWVNIDLADLPGVDVVADVTEGLDFRDCEAIFAEHFLEHLPLDGAVSFLAEAHRALGEEGLIRLSTPNLDWVWATHYGLDAGDEETKRAMAIHLNRAFRGWEHQFLWNRELLAEVLAACGFVDVEWCRYGESRHPIFRGLERHATYVDSPELPHVVIAEARKGPAASDRLAALRARFREEYLAHMSAI